MAKATLTESFARFGASLINVKWAVSSPAFGSTFYEDCKRFN